MIGSARPSHALRPVHSSQLRGTGDLFHVGENYNREAKSRGGVEFLLCSNISRHTKFTSTDRARWTSEPPGLPGVCKWQQAPQRLVGLGQGSLSACYTILCSIRSITWRVDKTIHTGVFC